jgi:DNA-directed RNA polymerase
LGVERFESAKKDALESKQGLQLYSVARLVSPATILLSEAIEKFLAECWSGKAGKKHAAAHLFGVMKPEELALITTRAVLTSIHTQTSLTSMCAEIASTISSELGWRALKNHDKKLHKFLHERCKKETSRNRTKAILDHNLKARNIEYFSFSREDAQSIGGKLVELMVDATGLIELTTRPTFKNGKQMTNYTIVAAEGTVEKLNDLDEYMSELTPVMLPMVIPPRPWTDVTDGGYLVPPVQASCFLKTRNESHIEELRNSDLSKVFSAMNAVQETAWRINTPVLEALQQIRESGQSIKSIPALYDAVAEAPMKPAFLSDDLPREMWTAEQLQQFKVWKYETAAAHSKDAALKSKRVAFNATMNVCNIVKDEPELYFVTQLDFRGRMYTLGNFLHPQGDDLARGLLEFAKGMAIETQEDLAWLQINLAGLYGFDKASLEDRQLWVEMRTDEILAVADDVLHAQLWRTADKPTQFIAACIDYANFVRTGYGYVSRLPVQVDGTCNGLQNFSAMLRDEVGGAAVNLVPRDLPSDVYADVAKFTEKLVAKDLASDDASVVALAKAWLEIGISRKVCKRPVMTLAYGATKFGFGEQIYKDTVEPLRQANKLSRDVNDTKLSSYLGDKIWFAVQSVIVKAAEAMEWLQEAATVVAKENLPVTWTTPDGLLVMQSYYKTKDKIVNLSFHKQRLQLVHKEQLSEPNGRKQASAIAPNFVHSCDATHMRMTINKMRDAGINDFSMIHDSYGTHAANAGKMSRMLREAFVEMYSNGVLEGFERDIRMQLSEDNFLRAIPEYGTLDLNQVYDSKFFFS